MNQISFVSAFNDLASLVPAESSSQWITDESLSDACDVAYTLDIPVKKNKTGLRFHILPMFPVMVCFLHYYASCTVMLPVLLCFLHCYASCAGEASLITMFYSLASLAFAQPTPGWMHENGWMYDINGCMNMDGCMNPDGCMNFSEFSSKFSSKISQKISQIFSGIFLEFSQNFLRIFSEFSQNFQNFLRIFSEFSQNVA